MSALSWWSSPPWFLHPFFMYIFASQLVTQTAAYTSPSSGWRPVIFLFLLAIAAYSMYWLPYYLPSGYYQERTLAGAFVVVVLLYFDRLLLKKWAFGPGLLGPEDLPDGKPGIAYQKFIEARTNDPKLSESAARRAFGQLVPGTCRCTGTRWEVKNVPHFSEKDPGYIPSPTDFLLRGSISVALYYVVLKLIMDKLAEAKFSSLLTDDHVRLFSRIGSVSAEELLFRFTYTLLFWVGLRCSIQFYYTSASIISVAFNPDSVKTCRPIFGSITYSYTLRNFWG
jgi:hypothetical protein